MEILLSAPRGFCAGVDRAIEIVERALKKYGAPIYVRHEIVHNKYVVNSLKEKGAVFVEEVSEVPANSVVIFSAHGVSKKVINDANQAQLISIDATCPLVKKVHYVVEKHHKKKIRVILIGHKKHPEVEGTMGQLEPNQMVLVSCPEDVKKLNFAPDSNLAYTTQTTLSIDETKDIILALKQKYPYIKGPEKGDLCYATTNRQQAILAMIQQVDLLLIIGSKNSSNSNRLKEIGLEHSKPSYLIDGSQNINKEWFHSIKTVGISSGASAPEILVQDVIQWLKNTFPTTTVREYELLKEKVHFPLPTELR